jgi:hypothetical protein
VSDDGPDVLLYGTLLRPAVVINRSGISRLGLPSSISIHRLSTGNWSEAQCAARETQGLVLSALDVFERQGSQVANPVAATDLQLMPRLAAHRLRASGIDVAAPPANGQGIKRLIVCAGRAVGDPGGAHGSSGTHAISEATADVIERSAAVLELVAGTIDILERPCRSPAVVAWSAQFASTDVTTCALALTALGAGPARGTAAGHRTGLFVRDLATPPTSPR